MVQSVGTKRILCSISGLSQQAKMYQAVYPGRSSSWYFTSQDRQAHLALEVHREMDWEVVVKQH